jgi:hypothetical protein
MHSFRPLAFALLLALWTSPTNRAADLKMAGISVPFFDPAGKPTHRLIAQEGRLSGGRQLLKGIEVVYFSAAEPAVVMQRVTTDEAQWDPSAKVLSGSGAITVATDENRLTGSGFDFVLATSQVRIHRDFTMANREVRLTSDRATIDLVVDHADNRMKFRDVRWCEAAGRLRVHIQPGARKKFPFESAASDLAIYSGETRVITFPHETRILAQGTTATFQRMELDLNPPETPPVTK